MAPPDPIEWSIPVAFHFSVTIEKKSVSFSDVKGIDFWYYATKGVNDYSGDKELFKITFGTGTDTIIIKSQLYY